MNFKNFNEWYSVLPFMTNVGMYYKYGSPRHIEYIFTLNNSREKIFFQNEEDGIELFHLLQSLTK